MTPLIVATDLCFCRNDLPVFSGIHLSVESGQVLHVLGANGVGKSTLLRLLAGLLVQVEGTVERHYEPFEMIYLGHRLGVKELLTVWENIVEGFSTFPPQSLRDSSPRRGEQNIPHPTKGEYLGLSLHFDTLAKDLSAGQRQRLALTKLLTRSAKLWILDEPFTALDREGVELFSEMLEKHCLQGGAAIIASHQALSTKNIPVKNLVLGEQEKIL